MRGLPFGALSNVCVAQCVLYGIPLASAFSKCVLGKTKQKQRPAARRAPAATWSGCARSASSGATAQATASGPSSPGAGGTWKHLRRGSCGEWCSRVRFKVLGRVACYSRVSL